MPQGHWPEVNIFKYCIYFRLIAIIAPILWRLLTYCPLNFKTLILVPERVNRVRDYERVGGKDDFAHAVLLSTTPPPATSPSASLSSPPPPPPLPSSPPSPPQEMSFTPHSTSATLLLPPPSTRSTINSTIDMLWPMGGEHGEQEKKKEIERMIDEEMS